MSGEVTKTAGAGRWTLLCTLIAAMLVLIVLQTQWRDAHALAATDESVMATSGQSDSVIPINSTVRTEVAAAPYAVVRVLTTVDNNLRSALSSAQLDSSQTSSSVGQSSSFVTDTNNKVPVTYGVLSYAGVNSPLAASYAPLPLPWERRSDAGVSKALGVEYAPHATAGTLVAHGMSGNGSVFESPALTVSSCDSNPSCGLTAQDSVSGRAITSDGGQSSVQGVLLLVSLSVITLVLTIHRRNRFVFNPNSPPPVEKWRISKRFGAPMRRNDTSE